MAVLSRRSAGPLLVADLVDHRSQGLVPAAGGHTVRNRRIFIPILIDASITFMEFFEVVGYIPNKMTVRSSSPLSR